MGLRLKEERKQDVPLPTVLLHPKVPVEQEMPKSHLCCMQQKSLQKGLRKGMSQKYSAELIGRAVGSIYVCVCVCTGMHTYLHSVQQIPRDLKQN